MLLGTFVKYKTEM